VTAFDAAMATLIADPNLAVAADYRVGGTGPIVPMRVLRSSPDRIADAFGTSVLQATDVLVVSVADLATVSAGDTFTIGAAILIVQHAERDATGTAWRVVCQR
jgi:predicted RecB family endonuclease